MPSFSGLVATQVVHDHVGGAHQPTKGIAARRMLEVQPTLFLFRLNVWKVAVMLAEEERAMLRVASPPRSGSRP